MKISTKRDALFAQLQTVTRAASTRSAVQALSGAHLQARGGAIELRATDMEIGLRVPLEGDVVREGAVVLPARLLVDVIRSLPGSEVSLELRTAEQDVEIVAGAATFHIRTLRLEDFPPFPEPDSDGRVQVPAAAFVATVNKVARSASRDETRPVLTGILVSASGSELVVKTQSGNVTVKLTGNTTYEITAKGTAADLKAGEQVVVSGQNSNGTITANTVRQGSFGGGFRNNPSASPSSR